MVTNNSTAMAAYQLGRMQEYEPGSESICTYLKRLDMYFMADDIACDKKVFTVIGRTIFVPKSPNDKSLADLVAILKSNFVPKLLVIAEQFNFYQRCKQGESICHCMISDDFFLFLIIYMNVKIYKKKWMKLMHTM